MLSDPTLSSISPYVELWISGSYGLDLSRGAFMPCKSTLRPLNSRGFPLGILLNRFFCLIRICEGDFFDLLATPTDGLTAV